MASPSNYVLAEYVWIGGHGEVRSKTKVIHGKASVTLSDLPEWNYDGSSTGQAPGTDSEVVVVPRAVYRDPFRRDSSAGTNVLVITDTYTPDKTPLPTNSRHLAAKVFAAKEDEVPWFGIEQEYTLFRDGRPLGWPKTSARSTGNPLHQIGYPAPQGPYYCSAGAAVAYGRDVVEAHLDNCLYAGLNVSGINAEVMPGQWEFQVGPSVGIESGDMMTAARYILLRTAEKFGVVVSLHPKPITGDWNGAGCHTNFSTKAMREEENSLEKVIYPALEKLKKRHQQHINSYGADNQMRLTGRHETAGIGAFTYGVANRGASVRIPNVTAMAGKGYFEDRRPASNMDPYVVTSMIFDTTVLNGRFSSEFAAVKTEGVDIAPMVERSAPSLKPEPEVSATPELDKLETAAAVVTPIETPKVTVNTQSASVPPVQLPDDTKQITSPKSEVAAPKVAENKDKAPVKTEKNTAAVAAKKGVTKQVSAKKTTTAKKPNVQKKGGCINQ